MPNNPKTVTKRVCPQCDRPFFNVLCLHGWNNPLVVQYTKTRIAPWWKLWVKQWEYRTDDEYTIRWLMSKGMMGFKPKLI